MLALPTATLLLFGLFSDCNGNGISDDVDIAAGTSLDCNGDGVPDECQSCFDCDDNGLLDMCETAAAGGLVGQYWQAIGGAGGFSQRLVVRIDDVVDFDWATGSPDPAIPIDDFSVRWTGTVTPVVSGTHTFYTTTDDGVRLWVDGVPLIDQWMPQSATTWSGSITLAAGVPYLIRMDYYEAGGDAVARLEWEAPGLAREVIPMSALHPSTDLDGDGWPESCGDCNGNGIADPQDFLDGTSFDCNGNCLPDECDVTRIEALGYWRFEEEGDPILDSGPYALHGTATNAVSIDAVPVDPVPHTSEPNARALELGGDGYVTVPDPGGLLTAAGASFTVEGWVRVDQLSDTSGPNQRQVLVQKKVIGAGDALVDYSVLAQGGNIQSSISPNFGKSSGITGRELVVLFGDGSGPWIVTSTLEITTTGWHHVSVAYDAGALAVRFGLDGMFETVSAPGPGHFANAGPLVIGAHTNASSQFNQFLRGAVDELRVADEVVPVDLLLRSYSTADCNGNGLPDGCDIADGTSEDCDLDGRPDECQPDCNTNGVPDGCDIVGGTSEDCNGDWIPDECQLAGNDCDGNGVLDACQIVEEDCNDNGIPDPCDITAGTSADCQGDGIPDECQIGEAVELSWDDGSSEYGIRSDGTYMAWLNGFDAPVGATVVDAIDVQFIFLPIGTQVDVHVWSDPNGDRNPDDAQALWSGTATVEQTDTLSRIEVPEVDLGSAGSFFVGFIAPVTTNDFPGALDTSGMPTLGRSWLVGANVPIDPNDLSAGAIEFETIEDALFPGNWVVRARMFSFGGDCNANGVPDLCDVQSGFSEDVDGNGVPDECEDCNGNGVPDGLDIAGGVSLDCQGDGIPDECQLGSGDCNGDGVPDDCQLDGNDCNGNGLPDGCDISSGFSDDVDANGIPDECEDCNGNGMLDSVDLAIGNSEDCNDDGIPDECQLGFPVSPFSYLLDDGMKETNLGVVAAVDFAWMNHFTVQPGAEWIAAIEVVWGNTLGGQPAEVILWSDGDGDGDPTDAQVLTSVATTTTNVNTNIYNVVSIPPFYVGPPGTSFFVGVHYDDVFNTAPIPIDQSAPDMESWIAWNSTAPLDLNDLTSGDVLTNSWEVMVRAVGYDGEATEDCNGNLVPDVCDIELGTSQDRNGNGIPDECECLGDTNDDGFVDALDVLQLIAEWGSPGNCPVSCAADFTGPGGSPDGNVDALDFLLLIAGWGDCPTP